MVIARAVKDVFIVGAKRTAFGTYGGSIKHLSNEQAQIIAVKAALEQANVDPQAVDSCNMGFVSSNEADGLYHGRHVTLGSGMKESTPYVNVSKGCASGFMTIIQSAMQISLGEVHISAAGGVEQMSRYVHALRGARFGIRLGFDPKLEDTLWNALTDINNGKPLPMGQTAENLAKKYSITRKDSDEFALRSHQNWAKANDAGLFKDEITPIEVKSKKGTKIFDQDEHPKANTTYESLSKLPLAFTKDGVITAGNASGICDGASCVVLASKQAIEKHNLQPIAKLSGYAYCGVDPQIMGIGPVPASQALLEATGTKMEDMDIIEINEAFAPQVIACARELNIDIEKLNLCGGGISIGHPLGTSGNRLTAHVSHALRRTGVRYGLATACVGGGNGVSLLLENV